ncbi:MAG: hypothetical protein AB7G11_10525 [Phycisphaerales bacterium]
MRTKTSTVMAAAIAFAAGWGLTLAQPGTPAGQPQPPDPAPRPSNPAPSPKDSQPGNEDPNKRTPLDRKKTLLPRPFALQSPQDEAKFTQNVQRLATMERKMQQSQEELLKRLGEVRSISGERQQHALYELLQTLIQNQAELNEYLIAVRSSWTGEVPAEDAGAPGDATRSNPGR